MRGTIGTAGLLALSCGIVVGMPPVGAKDDRQRVFDSLTPGAVVHGFRARAVYLGAEDRPLGARFVHGATGTTLDLLEIESAPQAYIAVNTFPTSDKGEPHTQEHL